MKNTTYNGYKNYNTWNIALWISNNYNLYNLAVDFMNNFKGQAPYKKFIEFLELSNSKTPDNVKYIDNKLSYRELNSFMRDLI
ncbi:DUF7249 family protein [Peptoniphilus timonensis]|uniref:DUF7249 family protein n=1 Tax=Peptoniphilus timonensis TaxID=1268254 RepID=UPI0002EF9045|nr:hypothetical protein [Peptoniphilus timonensis]